MERAGARVVEVRADSDANLISIDALLTALRAMGIRSLMVEGGAQVIQSFLAAAPGCTRGLPAASSQAVSSNLVDMIIVTVAPTFVGGDGIGYGSSLLAETLALQHINTELFGRDAVVALKVLLIAS